MADKLYRAGIIPYIIEDGVLQMLFMTPSDSKYGGFDPQVGKGKIEDNEQPLQAALREGEEELGLIKNNIAHIYTLGVYLHRTYIYLIRVKNKADFRQPTFETKRTDWMTGDEFETCGRPLHKSVVRAAVKHILG